jgi:hypothetical protein
MVRRLMLDAWMRRVAMCYHSFNERAQDIFDQFINLYGENGIVGDALMIKTR